MRTPLAPPPARIGTCPGDGGALELIRLHLPGWRTMAEGRCATCGREYLQDLPAGHGLVYPTTVDLTDGSVADPAGAVWFSSWPAPAFEHPDANPVSLAVEGAAKGPVVLVNCLDPVYGHALLRLLSVAGELARGDADVVVLVSRALAPLVPAGVAERWIVDEPLGRLRGWLTDLDARLHAELARLGTVALAASPPHPHPSTYDLADFVGDVDPERRGEPSVLIVLRDDRPWGPTREEEAARIAELSAALRAAHPEAGVTAIGLGASGGLPADVADLRAARPDEALERRWLACMRGADLAIGVHGSNLLLPSGLARATIELAGAERYSNVGQATLVAQTDPVLALARHRTLYGDADLADVGARRVADVATAVLDGLDRVEWLMTGPAAGQGDVDARLIAAEPRRGVHGPAVGEPAPPSLALRGRAVAGAVARRAAATVRERAARPAFRGSLPVVLQDDRGLSFELLTEEEAEAFVRHGGHFESQAIDLAVRALRPGDVAVDVGANIGAFTAAMARAAGPDGRVVAFEPYPPARARLERTLALNGLANVEISAQAVADADAPLELVDYGPGFESWSTLAPREIEMEGANVVPVGRTAVEGTTLDGALSERGIDRVAVLKIDVEGAEGRVVGGARELLAAGRIEVLLLEVSDNTLEADETNARVLLRGLADLGLAVHELDGDALRPYRPVGRVDRLVQAVALTEAGARRLGS